MKREGEEEYVEGWREGVEGYMKRSEERGCRGLILYEEG